MRRLSPPELDRVVGEAYALHDLLRGLLFRPEEIFLGFARILNAKPPGWYPLVVVRRGELECMFHILPMRQSDWPRLQRAWTAFVERLPETPEEDLRATIEKSETIRRRVEIIHVLMKKGFDLPTTRLPAEGAPS